MPRDVGEHVEAVRVVMAAVVDAIDAVDVVVVVAVVVWGGGQPRPHPHTNTHALAANKLCGQRWDRWDIRGHGDRPASGSAEMAQFNGSSESGFIVVQQTSGFCGGRPCIRA